VLANSSEKHTACIFKVEDIHAGKRSQARLLPPLDFLEKLILIREEDISNINIKLKLLLKSCISYPTYSIVINKKEVKR
jgi:hypothetical protein